jgi:4-amino-4-deoxy-L-arabinose transferase-like glycosyltransferase
VKRGRIAARVLDGDHYHLLLAVVFALALALRIGVAISFEGLSSPPNATAQPDQVDYEWFAYRLSAGDGFTDRTGAPTASRPPGTSLTLFPIYALSGRSFLLGRLWFCLLSAATCLATAWVARPCFGRPAALLAAAWLAVYPGHFYYPMHFVSEVPYALLITLACGFAVRALDDAAIAPNVAAGMMWGLAMLTRPQALFVVPVAWLFLWRSPRARWNRYARCLMVQTAVTLAVLLPWAARNSVQLGTPTLTTVGGHTFWGAHNDIVLHTPQLRGSWVRTSDLVDGRHPLNGSEVEREAAAWRYGAQFVRSNWIAMPGLALMKVWRLVSPFESTSNRVVLWAFAIAWLLTAPWVVAGLAMLGRAAPSGAVLLVPILATVVSSVVFYGSVRFRDSMLPLLIVFAARGVVEWVPNLAPAIVRRTAA